MKQWVASANGHIPASHRRLLTFTRRREFYCLCLPCDDRILRFKGFSSVDTLVSPPASEGRVFGRLQSRETGCTVVSTLCVCTSYRECHLTQGQAATRAE